MHFAAPLALTAALAPVAPAAAQTLPNPAAFEAALEAAVAKYPVKAVLAGIAIADAPPSLAARGETMTGVPATPDMRFRNGAVAIAYLGTLLLRMAEQGVVALDDPVARWFPDYPKAEAVTLEMLIRGTSGYADYVPDPDFLKALYDDPFRAWMPEELIAIGLGQPMACDPGQCWSYAHTNFVILGQILERAAGKPLADLLREQISEPMGLTATVSNQTGAIPEPVLHAFDAERGRYEESTFWNPSWTLAEGAVQTSTIADLLKTGRAIGTGALVSPASHEIQLDPATAKYPPWSADTYYAFGHFVIKGWVVQNPSFAGFAATMAYLPERDLAMAVSVTVDEDGDPDRNYSTDILKDVAAALLPAFPF